MNPNDKVNAVVVGLLEAGSFNKKSLAGRIGISTRTLDRRLRCETEWRLSDLLAISGILDISLGELLELIK